MQLSLKTINNSALTTQHLWKFLVLFTFLTYVRPSQQQQPAMANLNQELAKQSSLFSAKLYNEISEPNSNVIFSPFSIQACVAMARIGATGETAKEMDNGLNLVFSDVTSIADTFYNILAKYIDSPILKIANKIYVNDGYTIKKEFNEIISNKFFSAAEPINFAQNIEAANTINHWVESKTNNLIKNFILPEYLGSSTRLVLVNAIHFKGDWLFPFARHRTQNEDFYLNEVDTVKVPMMYLQADIPYVNLPELDATAIQLPYNNSDLSMLVILPNLRTGLNSLEQKLKTVLLTQITSKMTRQTVEVKFPKFKAESSIDLSEALQKLGMSRMFSNKAEFPNMLESSERIAVSKVIHKAFIDVNEEGTEAAAATAVVSVVGAGMNFNPPQKKSFIADKPFYYAIKTSEKLILFAGNIQSF